MKEVFYHSGISVREVEIYVTMGSWGGVPGF